MTEKLTFIVRACDSCKNKAVPLTGPGAACVNCGGEYTERAGTETMELTESEAESVRDEYPEALA